MTYRCDEEYPPGRATISRRKHKPEAADILTSRKIRQGELSTIVAKKHEGEKVGC